MTDLTPLAGLRAVGELAILGNRALASLAGTLALERLTTLTAESIF